MDKLIIIPEGKVCDYVDGTTRPDTPEKYVRQTVEKRLVNGHKYSKERIVIEYNVQIGGREETCRYFCREGKGGAGKVVGARVKQKKGNRSMNVEIL